MRDVPPQDWHAAVVAAREDGHGWFDWLGCVDEIGVADELRVVLSLRRLDDPGAPELLLQCRLPRSEPRIDSVRDVFAGAAWHEREAAEEFGLDVVGGDRRRLLLDPSFTGAPLRKDEVLASRTAQPWPGAKEPGESDAGAGGRSPSRRRMVPPGVPAPEVWGDRDPAEPPPDPGEVAAATSGGRVRRRAR
ncbi:NADH-quinone oxidoreductase subunit C [Microlunatus flavus]|uniref:NADH-quinone oxidoreductase subunit C n=1 Tax=Microlunatus flavus TaxID=1036181 RepID=A0A1H9LW29_9ACTN|nr:NADH-quinone oxidoreductase subunit C [Microlunatus flavus]SER15053.1 NADH-quinone oxidoreductase subunit C [Microlunatus flavus]